MLQVGAITLIAVSAIPSSVMPWWLEFSLGTIGWFFLYGALIAAENRGKEKVEIKHTTINVTGKTTFTIGQ